MTRSPLRPAAAGLCLALALGLACVPVQPPAPLPEPAPPAGPPRLPGEEALHLKLQGLAERAERPDLTDEEEGALLAEVDSALSEVLDAPEPLRSTPLIQGSVERLTDLVLQLELDANAAPPEPAPSLEGTPLEAMLSETTFIPEADLQSTLEAVRRAQASVQLDLPVPADNPAVLSYVNLYQKRYRNWFAATLERAAPRLPSLQRTFKDAGVPPELVWLAAVESAFRTDAVSRAKAVGMWQFIAGTAKRYGLQVDYWEDQRLDPEVASRASARYLKDLYDMFGDWPLALASYNAGEFKVLRGLKRTGKKTFWELRKTNALRRETREYVPAIFAAVLIGTNPEAYGFQGPDAPPLEPAVTVPLDRAMDLRLLARCADMTPEALQALNPSLKRLVTPPRPFQLRLPPERVERFQTALAQVPEEERLAVAVHTVQPGETLAKVAKRYGVTTGVLRTVNRLRSNSVKPGTELAVPIGPAASDPVLYAEERPQDRRPQRIYKVRSGDSLSSIAARTGVPVARLKELNGLESDRLRVGQRLVLTAGAPSGAPSPAAAAAPAAAAGSRVHHVVAGDTLYDLARKYGTTVNRICQLNRITAGKVLRPGDSLLIPQ